MRTSPGKIFDLAKDERSSATPLMVDPLLQHAVDVALAAPQTILSDVTSWHGHVPFAQALVALARPRLVVELGVHKGDSYRAFTSAMARYEVEGKAHGVDTWLGDEHAGGYDGDAVLREVNERNAPYSAFSQLLRKTFDEAVADFADGSIDLLHIDGLHTYEAVRHDFETWEPKLSERSIVLFHDTTIHRDDFGVFRFWDEIKSSWPSFNFPHSNGLGVIYKEQGVNSETLAFFGLLQRAEADGISPLTLVTTIGEAYAARAAASVFHNLYQSKEAEVRNIQTNAMVEIDRLNREIVTIRCEQQTERDQLAAETERLRGELASARAANDAAVREAEMRRRRSLSGRSRAAVRFAKRGTSKAIRITGRTAIYSLPVSRDVKTRLKYRIIARFGPLLGVGVGRREYDLSNSTQVSLHDVGERYLDIARSATGKPADIPARSVSIIIPVHNQIDYTLRCLESIARHTQDIEHEVIVVDDASSDETLPLLSRRDDLIFIRNDRNLGFIGSCNAGLARSSMNYVIYLNNDTEVGPGWLTALVNTFELNDHVGLVGSKLIYPDGKLQEAGGLIWDDFSGWNWGRMQDPEDPRYNYVRHADYCSGAALLLSRSLAEAFGGFDSHFAPAYGEDSDLAFKVRTLGLSVLYQPLSQVIHYEGISSGTDVTKGVKAHQVVNANKLAERWAPVLPHQGANGVDAEFAADRGRIGHVLVLDQITPEPDRDAGSITSLELMRALRDSGYKVTFVPCSNFTYVPDYTDALAALGIESVLYPWTRSAREHLERFGSRYDAVVLFRPNTASDLLPTVRELAPRAKIIFHTSDLHFLREERAQAVENPDLPERHHAAQKTKTKELKIIKACDVTIVHSHFEHELLSGLLPKSHVVVFPWLYEPRGSGLPPAERHDIVFLGGYRHYPNVDAVLAFAENILPLLLPKHPDIVFHAVGSNPPEEMAQLASRNIRITGFVEDISSQLWSARMMVAPLRYGAGLKGKIVTAMAHGLPVITTTIGAEGMGLADGIDVLIADEPEDIAATIERLNADDELWNSLSKAGLDYVARTTSREVGYGIVRNILETAGLPAVPRLRAGEKRREFVAAFGSPAVLTDARTLLGAVAGQEAQGGLLIVPHALEGLEVDGWAVSTPGKAVSQAARVIAIADAASAAEVAGIAECLPRVTAEGGRASIVFAPPRLVASAGGYSLQQAFADTQVHGVIQPPHLMHGRRLAAIGGRLSWRADATILGFPSIMIADWEP